jgi:hypothetical protein
MFIHIPSELSGVDRVGNQWIETRFTFFLPTSSFLSIMDKNGRREHYAIPLHLKSVLIWYIRVFLMVATLLAGVVGALEAFLPGRHGQTTTPPRGLPTFLLILAAPLAAFLWSAFRLGRLSPQEQYRRKVLGKITGYLADPAIFKKADSTRMLEGLRTRAAEAGLNLSPDHWERTVPAPESLPLLFTLAMFEKQFPGGEPWARLAEDFWKMLEQQGHGTPPR